MDGSEDKIRAMLERIADALGYSPTTFVEMARGPNALDETAELLRLWTALESPARRRQALTVIRSLAEAEERQEVGPDRGRPPGTAAQDAVE